MIARSNRKRRVISVRTTASVRLRPRHSCHSCSPLPTGKQQTCAACFVQSDLANAVHIRSQQQPRTEFTGVQELGQGKEPESLRPSNPGAFSYCTRKPQLGRLPGTLTNEVYEIAPSAPSIHIHFSPLKLKSRHSKTLNP